ncbi:hypothetical protein BGZ94_002310, partial [Podila epigama]
MDLPSAPRQPSAEHPPEHYRVHESNLDYTHEPHTKLDRFIVHASNPLNAEPQLPLLVENYITPTDIFFKRNHGPMPDIKAHEHKVFVGVQQNAQYYKEAPPPIEWRSLTMTDIMTKWPKAT